MGVLLTADNIAEAVGAPTNAPSVIAAPPGAAAAPALARDTPTMAMVPDDAVQRLIKLIPGEAAALYTAACALSNARELPLVAFVLSLVVLVLSLRRDGLVHKPPIKPELTQYVFRSLAFAVWAIAIRNPLEFLFKIPHWIPGIAILFVPAIGTFVIGGDDGQS